MFFKSRKVIGLDIGTSSVKLAELEVTRAGATLSRFAYSPLPLGCVSGGEILDVPQVSEAIRHSFQEGGFKTKSSCAGMFGTSVIIKKIAMPRMDTSLIAEQIRWEAEQYIPFDLSEVNIDFHILKSVGRESEALDVLLVAAKQDLIFRYFEAIQSAGIRASIVDVAGFALANCFEFNYGRPREPVVALLNIGAGVTNFVVVENGEVTFCRDIPVGGATYTSDINKELGVSFEEAEVLKLNAAQQQEVPHEVHTAIASTNELVAEEINNSFDFYSATTSGVSISKIYVSGGGMYVPGLLDQLTHVIGIPYEVVNPFQRIGYNRKVFSRQYIDQIRPFVSVVLGLALRKDGDS